MKTMILTLAAATALTAGAAAAQPYGYGRRTMPGWRPSNASRCSTAASTRVMRSVS
jgi:hypothetical protein